MTSTVELVALAQHMEWADAQIWTSLLGVTPAQADDRLRLLVYHVHIVQRAFLSLWRGEAPQFPDPAAFPDPASLAAWGRDGHTQIQRFLASADEAALARPLQVPWAVELEKILGRPTAHATVAQTAVQVALHSSHHRGQINVRLRTAGGEPPLVDYIAWVWSGQPQAAWPASVA
ncbi:MAG: damage-inducible protein DinB [Acidobacteria bacterium]|nr:damage-inducible protein DinB [Acidobacteriota bacterium]